MKPPFDNELLALLDKSIKNNKMYFKPYINANRSSDIFEDEI